MESLEELEARLSSWIRGEEPATGGDINRLKAHIKKLKKDAPKLESYTIVCQWTGLEFEAPSKRYKTHPGMSVTSEWPSSYRSDYAAKAKELGTFDHPDMYVLRQQIVDELNAQAQARLDKERQYKKDQKDAALQRESRRQLNTLLRNAGYKWVKVGFVDEEDADFYAGFATAEIGQYWELVRESDGASISVQDALREILPRNSRASQWIKDDE